MKRIVIISFIIAFFVGLFYFFFTVPKLYHKNIRLTFLQKLSVSYVNLPTKSLYYGQKEYTLQTYREILANSDYADQLRKYFPKLKLYYIKYDVNEDAKTLFISLYTKNKDKISAEKLGNFTASYFNRFFRKLSNESLEFVTAEKNIIKNKILGFKDDLQRYFKLKIPEQFGNYYYNYKIKYGNAPIPGELYLQLNKSEVSSLIFQSTKNSKVTKNIKFSDDLIKYIFDLYLFNSSLSQYVILDNIENDLTLLSTSKLSPLSFIGGFNFSLSKKELLLKTIIVFLAIFIIIFTILYVFKKD